MNGGAAIQARQAPGSPNGRVVARPFIHARSADEQPAKARLGQILGSYRLLEVLGEGGMGIVYLAEHVRLGRRVALKLLYPSVARESISGVKRFFGEAKAISMLNHEHVVEVIDLIEGEGVQSECYFIMELLSGFNLARQLFDTRVLPVDRVLHIGMQLAETLSVVHAAGIVHRDIKPENIILIKRGGDSDFVKLLDFGVAKLPHSECADTHVQTVVGTVLGTPRYMSPEQLMGLGVDCRTDIYALGVLLYRMVTGDWPVKGRDLADLAENHLSVMPEAPSCHRGAQYPIPEVLDQLIMQCLAKDREARPQSMSIIADRLREVSYGVTSVEHRRVDRTEKGDFDAVTTIAEDRRPGTRLVAIVGALLLGVVLGALSSSWTSLLGATAVRDSEGVEHVPAAVARSAFVLATQNVEIEPKLVVGLVAELPDFASASGNGPAARLMPRPGPLPAAGKTRRARTPALLSQVSTTAGPAAASAQPQGVQALGSTVTVKSRSVDARSTMNPFARD